MSLATLNSCDRTPEEIMESRLMYSLPDGDGGFAQKREIQEFYCDAGPGATFKGGDAAMFTLSSSGMVIDPSNTFLFFKVQLTAANITSTPASNVIPILPTGASGMINQIDILSYGGVTIESIPDYNLLAAILDAYTISKTWRKEFGLQEAYPPVADEDRANVQTNAVAVNSSTGVFAAPTTGKVGVGFSSALQRYSKSLLEGRYICLPLRASGLFGGQKYIPLNVLGTLRIQIRFEYLNKFVQLVGLDCVSASTALGYESGLAVKTADATYAATNALALSVGDYTVSELKMVCAMVRLSSAMQSAIDAAVKGDGLPMHFASWARMRTNIPGGSAAATLTQVLPKNASNVLSVFSVFYTDPAASATTAVADEAKTGAIGGGTTVSLLSNKFDFWQHGVREWQYRVGTSVFPAFRVRNAVEGYKVSMEAIPRLPWADKGASCPLERYTWEGQEKAHYAGYGTTCTAVAAEDWYPNISNPKFATDSEHYPNKFIMGVNLQATPGLPLSGLSTASGQQPIIEISQYGNLNPVVIGNERMLQNSELITWMHYMRVIVLQSGQNVTVKE